MLRHDSEDMDLYTDPETWILQRILRYIWMLRHESDTWILQRILRYIWMLIYGSGDMDLAEEPEIQRC